jgi:hypothetical protein
MGPRRALMRAAKPPTADPRPHARLQRLAGHIAAPTGPPGPTSTPPDAVTAGGELAPLAKPRLIHYNDARHYSGRNRF